jgi:hypothetical protein
METFRTVTHHGVTLAGVIVAFLLMLVFAQLFADLVVVIGHRLM